MIDGIQRHDTVRVIRSVDEKGSAIATAIYFGLFNLGIGGAVGWV